MTAPFDLPVADWDPEADDTLVCRAVRDETHDVKTFVFEARPARRFNYLPGQFLTFEFEIGGQTINRCYTIASSPARPYLISITSKRTPGGPVSNWLHDTLRPGAAVRVTGPMGEFTCAHHPVSKQIYFSAGSGITPLMSMARAHQDLASDADILFVHSARSPADLIFRDELARMGRERPAFQVVQICETDAPDEVWAGERGRLDDAMLARVAPDLMEREAFLCGPAPYMASVRALLERAGFDPARLHAESFDFEDLATAEPEAPDTSAASSGGGFKVTFAKLGREIDCPADTFVLTAARNNGVRLPSSCTQGMCGTCKSRLISGTVAMTHAGGIRQREIDQGLVLLCCSRPTSDLVVDR